MAAITPRRSQRLPYTHTPKMSERKKGLFVMESQVTKESLTEHRRLPVVDSESDGDDCDLGIISTLDSSSCDENDSNHPKTPERVWHGTRSQSKKLLKESQDLKNFMKSPFTLMKYQTRYSGADGKTMGSLSTPATPHFQNHPGTPSSTHSCGSIQTTSSTTSRARKSLASLIADTESCSSSLKDLNFDTDSSVDSKENTPTKATRRSTRKSKGTPKMNSFKGILVEQKKNLISTLGISPMKSAFVCLTKIDMDQVISPTQMLKTPHTTMDANMSPPKLRKSMIEIEESPETTCDSEKSYKRLRNDSITDYTPKSKHPRLDNNAPKARLSLFNSDRLKEILSAKSFYGKTNPELNTNVAAKLSNAIEVTSTQHRKTLKHSSHSRKKRPGQINMGVRHRIRKPKLTKTQILNMKTRAFMKQANAMNNSTVSNGTCNKTMPSQNNSMISQNTSMASQNTSQELDDKIDPFDKERQTIDDLLSQWTEEEEPELVSKPKQVIPCFNPNIIEETNQIFEPITAVAVPLPSSLPLTQDNNKVIVEIGSKAIADLPQNVTNLSPSPEPQDVVMTEGHSSDHGKAPKCGQFLPVEGGYILVEDNGVPLDQEVLPDLDEIEREMRMLDEQILKMASSNNMDAAAVFASTETRSNLPSSDMQTENGSEGDKPQKLFPIFSNPNPGVATDGSKGALDKHKKTILKTGTDQYVIDAGQKVFGATQCNECGVIYQIGDPQDEHDHLVHHNSTDVLKFNGWKDEVIVGRSANGRCIRVRGGETGWKKVETLMSRVIHPQLGYDGHLPAHKLRAYTAYLYVEKKQIIGCLIVEPKVRAYKMIPGDPDCCSVEDYPVKCGVSRLWTHKNYRRIGVAARLMDCARASFLYGSALSTNDLAFSAPTQSGKAFATKYCGTQNFYVYLD